MKIPFSGGCACGAIRYECTAEPIAMFKCHCRDCQRVSGGAYSPVVLVSSSAFKVTQGELRYHFTDSQRGGRHKRGYCVDCGSRLTGSPSDKIGILAGSLDDPTVFRPSMDIFICDVQPWDRMDPDSLKHDDYPRSK